jgi:molybdenum cofactor guanylyltransferase
VTTMLLNGLVLCGGRSSRMGEDKSLINYNGEQQYIYSYKLLAKFCEKIYLSCNTSQAVEYDPLPCIVDKHNNQGPLEGIRNAFDYDPSTSWLIMPCDMPLIGEKEINLLINERSDETDAVCFKDSSGDINPLLGIWEQPCGILLKEYSGDSPKRFLETIRLNVLQLDDQKLANINNPQEKEKILKDLKITTRRLPRSYLPRNNE